MAVQVVTALERGRAYEILLFKVRKRHKRKKRDFALFFMLFASDWSESDFFSLWYINSYLNIGKDVGIRLGL